MRLKEEKNITFVFCALIYIERFTFLDHKEIIHKHDGRIFCYRKYGTNTSQKNLTLPVLWDFPVWDTRKTIIVPNFVFLSNIRKAII